MRRGGTSPSMRCRDDAGRCLFDYFGGLADLRLGRLRFVGDPVQRIAEDYLMRVLRFSPVLSPDMAQLSRMKSTALPALHDAAPRLATLSAERIWHELTLHPVRSCSTPSIPVLSLVFNGPT